MSTLSSRLSFHACIDLTNLTNIGWPPKQSIHNQGIEYLANLTKLAVLDFSDCINLADEGAIHLSRTDKPLLDSLTFVFSPRLFVLLLRSDSTELSLAG